MTKRIKLIFITILAAILVFFTAGGALIASAEEVPETTPTEETDGDSSDIEQLAADFVSWLKDTFGEDYEKYYNNIITNWGSIEEYLLQFGEENLPEQYQTGWQKFVGWLGEYSAIWAPILAVAIVVIVYIIGKKRFEAIVKKAVDSKTSALGAELNKQSKAQAAGNRAIRALLGTNEKFAENVKELEESEKELSS